jgi:hypothetical protein
LMPDTTDFCGIGRDPRCRVEQARHRQEVLGLDQGDLSLATGPDGTVIPVRPRPWIASVTSTLPPRIDCAE